MPLARHNAAADAAGASGAAGASAVATTPAAPTATLATIVAIAASIAGVRFSARRGGGEGRSMAAPARCRATQPASFFLPPLEPPFPATASHHRPLVGPDAATRGRGRRGMQPVRGRGDESPGARAQAPRETSQTYRDIAATNSWATRSTSLEPSEPASAPAPAAAGAAAGAALAGSAWTSPGLEPFIADADRTEVGGRSLRPERVSRTAG